MKTKIPDYKKVNANKHHLNTWKAKMWLESPLKAQMLNAQEQYIRDIERNVEFILKMQKYSKTEFKRWLRSNKVTASRYMFSPRDNRFAPFVTLVDMLMIAKHLRVGVEDLMFSDIASGYKNTRENG